MKLLVSICNKVRAERATLPGVFLFEVNTEQSEPRPVALEYPQLDGARGITGLTCYREGMLALMQSRPVKLIYFTKQYRVENVWPLALVQNGHSLAVADNKVYVASTGTDSIVEFDPELGEHVLWRDNEQGQDTIHLNSLLWHKGDLYVTAFGKKRGELWSSADAGYLVNLTSERIIISPLYHPHSAFLTDEGIYFCESSRMAVGREDGQHILVGTGYTRGLVITDTRVYVGTSKGRTRSESTGKVIDNPADPGLKAGRCGVLIYRREEEGLAHSKFIKEISLEEYGEEIYDILPL